MYTCIDKYLSFYDTSIFDLYLYSGKTKKKILSFFAKFGLPSDTEVQDQSLKVGQNI